LAASVSPSNNPQSDGGYSQNTRKRDEPEGKVGRWIATGLFPKPVIFAFFCGACVGFLILAIAWWSIEKRERNKEPESEEEYTSPK
jgi:hypothetical protein